MKYCKHCKEDLPGKRSQLGYSTCISCSQEPKWSAIPVIHHKTGNEIQIVKDPEVAAEFYAKTQRIGFGTMRGMTSSYTKKPKILKHTEDINTKALPPDREISRTPLPNEYEKIGGIAIDMVLEHRIYDAKDFLDKSLVEKKIYPAHYRNILEMIHAITSNELK